MTHEQPNPELPDPPADPFTAIANALMAYREELERVREQYIQTRDPAVRRALYEQLTQMRALITGLKEGR